MSSWIYDEEDMRLQAEEYRRMHGGRNPDPAACGLIGDAEEERRRNVRAFHAFDAAVARMERARYAEVAI